MSSRLDFRLGDNVNSTARSRDLYVESFEDVSLPGTRQSLTEIPYKDGFILTGDTSRKGIKRVAHCYLKSYTNMTAAYVLQWVRNNNKVFFSDEGADSAGTGPQQALFRYYSVYDDMIASRVSGGALELDITFICQPYRYLETPTTVNVTYAEGTSESGKVVENIGNTANAPLVRVGRANQAGGSAWIAWGSYASERIEFTDLKYPLYIDTELKEVYYEDSSHGNANLITSLNKFPSIPGSGQRTIKFGGNVAQLQISMRERML